MSMQECKSCGKTFVMLRTPQSNVPYCPNCGVLQESPEFSHGEMEL